MHFQHIQVPADGQAITIDELGQLNVPENPIIPFIQGDGIGGDVTRAMIRVVDAAVRKVYGTRRKLAWMEIYAGERAVKTYGADQWLPQETLTAMQKFVVSIKGPLTTPVGGGMRSLNVAIRQLLDLYICLRPVRYFTGTPSPLKEPWKTNMVIFRENAEDIYAGIEWQADSVPAKKIIKFLQDEMGVTQIRFPEHCGIGVKPVSKSGTTRLVKAAIQYALDQKRDSLTLVHKGNIMKFTEGAFKTWGYEVAEKFFKAQDYEGGPWKIIKDPKTGHSLIIKDVIADAFLQQILLRPEEYSVIATLNLNGDYISDALAAQVGGIGIAPGANLGEGVAVFEATHGTAPKYADQDKVNPGSLILSAEMMLRHLGWNPAADAILHGVERSIIAQTVTYDFARLMPGATCVSCSGFANAIIDNF